MKKKKYKIIKSELYKKQEKKLSAKTKKDIKEMFKTIAKDPMNAPNTMSLFGKPTPQELKQWVSGTKPHAIDLVFEYLRDKNCLNKKGSKLAHDFWKEYIERK